MDSPKVLRILRQQICNVDGTLTNASEPTQSQRPARISFRAPLPLSNPATAEEVIGHSITIVIPQDRHSEEREILARIRRGERVEHFETVRQRKHGSLIAVSLTISPVKNAEGKIVGASKIARDITERKRNDEHIVALAREAQHRTKNILATVQA